MFNHVEIPFKSEVLFALTTYYCLGKNGRPNLTTSPDKESSISELDSRARRRLITGPDGKKWVSDAYSKYYSPGSRANETGAG